MRALGLRPEQIARQRMGRTEMLGSETGGRRTRSIKASITLLLTVSRIGCARSFNSADMNRYQREVAEMDRRQLLFIRALSFAGAVILIAAALWKRWIASVGMVEAWASVVGGIEQAHGRRRQQRAVRLSRSADSLLRWKAMH